LDTVAPERFEARRAIKVATSDSPDLDVPSHKDFWGTKPVMNINDVKFDDVEENGLYTSSRGQISDLDPKARCDRMPSETCGRFSARRRRLITMTARRPRIIITETL
jgi:hypothetical protein